MKSKIKNMGMQRLDSQEMEVIVGGSCTSTDFWAGLTTMGMGLIAGGPLGLTAAAFGVAWYFKKGC